MYREVEGAVEVRAPVSEAYEYWRNLENLPRFMEDVEEVRVTGPDTAHWVVKGPSGRRVEFDARTTWDEPNRVLAWEPLAGEPLAGGAAGSGQVRFLEEPGGLTRVEFRVGLPGPPRTDAVGGRALERVGRDMGGLLGLVASLVRGATGEAPRWRRSSRAHGGRASALASRQRASMPGDLARLKEIVERLQRDAVPAGAGEVEGDPGGERGIAPERQEHDGVGAEGRHLVLGDLSEEDLAALAGRQAIPPAAVGSGLSDVSENHDHYLTGGGDRSPDRESGTG